MLFSVCFSVSVLEILVLFLWGYYVFCPVCLFLLLSLCILFLQPDMRLSLVS